MKKRILLFTLSAGLGIMAFSSYVGGPAAGGAGNLTGSKGTITTCGGGGCHGGQSANTTVTIVVDTVGGAAVTQYRPGATYTIKITGSNTNMAALPKFGFQFTSVSGSGVSQVQAGTSSAPTNCHITTVSGIKVVEHSVALSAVSGSYTVSIPWTAPLAGTGTVTMYCTLNAVDGLGGPDAADVSNHTSFTLSEGFLGIGELSQDIAIKTYPNPATNQFTIKMDNAGTGVYNVNVYDMSGRIVATQAVQATGANTVAVINCASWAKGYYGVQISQNGAQRTLPVVKL